MRRTGKNEARREKRNFASLLVFFASTHFETFLCLPLFVYLCLFHHLSGPPTPSSSPAVMSRSTYVTVFPLALASEKVVDRRALIALFEKRHYYIPTTLMEEEEEEKEEEGRGAAGAAADAAAAEPAADVPAERVLTLDQVLAEMFVSCKFLGYPESMRDGCNLFIELLAMFPAYDTMQVHFYFPVEHFPYYFEVNERGQCNMWTLPADHALYTKIVATEEVEEFHCYYSHEVNGDDSQSLLFDKEAYMNMLTVNQALMAKMAEKVDIGASLLHMNLLMSNPTLMNMCIQKYLERLY